MFDERAAYRQIEKGIRELNGTSKTFVTLGADDGCYMSIGGGESGKYIVNVTFDNVSFYNLVDPSKPDAIEKLVIGGQEGNYSAKMCVKLETALLAAQTFTQGCFILRRGKPPVVAPRSETPVKSSVGGRARGHRPLQNRDFRKNETALNIYRITTTSNIPVLGRRERISGVIK